LTPKVTFCDVGQGDGIIVSVGFQQMVVDAGKTPTSMSACLTRALPWWDHQLEVVVATHPDADHIGGLPAIFESYQVKNFVTTGAAKDTLQSQELQEKVDAEHGLRVLMAQPGQIWRLGTETKIEVIWPNLEWLEEAENANDGSIILLVTAREQRVLLTGDLELPGEDALTEQWRGQVDVLKVGHHGANTSSSAKFLEVTAPTWGIISAGRQNQYGHPHPDVMSRLEAARIQIWRTDQSGDITAEVHPQGIRWRTQLRSASSSASRASPDE
jgi:competence protein ComEC